MTKSNPEPCPTAPPLASRYVYVVATGQFRFAVESETPLELLSALKEALPRFEKAGYPLGSLVEITECSDDADPSNPHYISTISALELLGESYSRIKEP